MSNVHPIFEQAMAPFLKPVANRNGPVIQGSDGHWYCGSVGPFMTKTQAIQHILGVKEVIHD